MATFLSACLNGDLAQVQAYLRDGSDPNMMDDRGISCLLNAIRRRDFGLVSLLLDASASASIGYTNHECPLVAAARTDQCHIVKLILDAKASISANSPYSTMGLISLNTAIRRGSVAIAKLLLSSKPLLNSPHGDRKGRTPLCLAVLAGDQDMVKLLLEHDADPYTEDYDGCNAISYATQYNQHDILRLFTGDVTNTLESTENDLKQSCTGTGTATDTGAQSASQPISEAPLTSPFSADAAINDDLLASCARLDTARVKSLLNDGADATAVDANGCSALMRLFSPDSSRYVLQSPSRSDIQRRPPHPQCASCGLDTPVDDCGDKDADECDDIMNYWYNPDVMPQQLSIKSFSPGFPLMSTPYTAIASMLLDAGCDVLATDARGGTVLHRAHWPEFRARRGRVCEYCIENDGEAVRKVDLQYSHDVATAIHSKRDFLSAVELVLRRGGDALLNHRDSAGYTPLMWLSAISDPSLTRVCLQMGANANEWVVQGDTMTSVLTLACVGPDHIHPATIAALLQCAADASAKDNDGIDPLQHLLRAHRGRWTWRLLAVAEALVGAGADSSTEDVAQFIERVKQSGLSDATVKRVTHALRKLQTRAPVLISSE